MWFAKSETFCLARLFWRTPSHSLDLLVRKEERSVHTLKTLSVKLWRRGHRNLYWLNWCRNMRADLLSTSDGMATSWQEKRTKIKLIKRLKQDPIRHSVADTQYLELLRQCNFCGEQRLDHHCVDVVALYTNTDSGGAVEACVQLLRLSHEKIQISGWTKILWRCLEPWQKSTHPVSEMRSSSTRETLQWEAGCFTARDHICDWPRPAGLVFGSVIFRTIYRCHYRCEKIAGHTTTDIWTYEFNVPND